MLNESPDDVMDVYVPGRWRCPKCEFQLSSATLFMGSGEIGCTRDQVMNMTGECCQNDGTPMGRVTWREEADANRKWGTDLMEEIIGATYSASLPEALESARRYRKALESIAASACCDRCNEAKLVASAALRGTQADPAGATPSVQGAPASAQDSSSEITRLRSLLQTTEAEIKELKLRGVTRPGTDGAGPTPLDPSVPNGGDSGQRHPVKCAICGNRKMILTGTLCPDCLIASNLGDHGSIAQQSVDAKPFVDTLVLAARRRAFDSPTIANLDALIQAAEAKYQTTEAARDEAQRAAAEWREKLAAAKTRIVVDRDADLLIELRVWLDFQTITSDNIGDLRRSLFVPWDSIWNGWVRGETAERENRHAGIQVLEVREENHGNVLNAGPQMQVTRPKSSWEMRAEALATERDEAVRAFEGFALECAQAYGAAHLSTPEIVGIVARCSQTESRLSSLTQAHARLVETVKAVEQWLRHWPVTTCRSETGGDVQIVLMNPASLQAKADDLARLGQAEHQAPTPPAPDGSCPACGESDRFDVLEDDGKESGTTACLGCGEVLGPTQADDLACRGQSAEDSATVQLARLTQAHARLIAEWSRVEDMRLTSEGLAAEQARHDCAADLAAVAETTEATPPSPS